MRDAKWIRDDVTADVALAVLGTSLVERIDAGDDFTLELRHLREALREFYALHSHLVDEREVRVLGIAQ